MSDYFRGGQKFRTGKIEYESILKNTSNEVVDTFKGQTMPRRSYTKYSDEECGKIGRYTFENGNEWARQNFLLKYPLLMKSIVWSFKRAHKEQLQKQSEKMNLQPVTRITPQSRGRPPILLELNASW